MVPELSVLETPYTRSATLDICSSFWGPYPELDGFGDFRGSATHAKLGATNVVAYVALPLWVRWGGDGCAIIIGPSSVARPYKPEFPPFGAQKRLMNGSETARETAEIWPNSWPALVR
jgi:hypothetical protein